MAKRLLREPGAIERVALLLSDKNDGKLTEAEVIVISKQESTIKEAIRYLNIVDLKAKIFEEHRGFKDWQDCYEEAVYLVNNIPEELMINLEEWLDEKPLSDIKLYGISISDLLEEYTRCFHIFDALKCFIKWKETGYENKDFCHWYFSRA